MYCIKKFNYGRRISQIFYDEEFKEYTVYFVILGMAQPPEYYTTDYHDAVSKALDFCRN